MVEAEARRPSSRWPTRALQTLGELGYNLHAAYGALDGLFQQALLAYLCGDEDTALEELTDQVRNLMPLMLAGRRS